MAAAAAPGGELPSGGNRFWGLFARVFIPNGAFSINSIRLLKAAPAFPYGTDSRGWILYLYGSVLDIINMQLWLPGAPEHNHIVDGEIDCQGC